MRLSHAKFKDVLAANQRMKLTGAAILIPRGMTLLKAAPAAYPCR